MSDESAIMRSMREHSAKRMKTAEEAERRSMLAFQSGKFEDYWLSLGREAEDRVEAEHADAESEHGAADTEAERGGEVGGGQPGDDVPEDDRDDSPESAAEEPSPTD